MEEEDVVTLMNNLRVRSGVGQEDSFEFYACIPLSLDGTVDFFLHEIVDYLNLEHNNGVSFAYTDIEEEHEELRPCPMTV